MISNLVSGSKPPLLDRGSQTFGVGENAHPLLEQALEFEQVKDVELVPAQKENLF